MIGKLSKLTELILSGCSLVDHFIILLCPSKFNFSTFLSVFDLSFNTFTSPMILQWVSNISSELVELNLNGNLLDGSMSKDFGTIMIYQDLSHIFHHSNGHNWRQMICKLPKLRKLRLSSSSLSDFFFFSLTLCKFNFSTSLSIFDLSGNSSISSMIFQQVSNISPNLVELDLSDNLLQVNASSHFRTMVNYLEWLDLSNNRLKGGDLKSFMSICTLRSLHLLHNNMTEDLPLILLNLSVSYVR